MTQEISKGIMKSLETTDGSYTTYRIGCTCGDRDCDVTMAIDADPWAGSVYDHKELGLEFYSRQKLPVWKKGFSRIKYALKVLFLGELELETRMLLNEKQALQLSDLIKEKITKQSVKCKLPVKTKKK